MNAWLVKIVLSIETYLKQPIDSKKPTCMASPSQDIPKIEGTPTTSESPHAEDDSYLHPKLPYEMIPHDEINAHLGGLLEHTLVKSENFH
jgi:hypothetical protein